MFCSLSHTSAYCSSPYSRISDVYANPEPSFYILKLCVCIHIHACARMCIRLCACMCISVLLPVCACTHSLLAFSFGIPLWRTHILPAPNWHLYPSVSVQMSPLQKASVSFAHIRSFITEPCAFWVQYNFSTWHPEKS